MIIENVKRLFLSINEKNKLVAFLVIKSPSFTNVF